ncbi:MAG: amidase [Cyclobacteriaceae bacterium]|nr:amidase [Cyclobacteriaceae bacterium]
MQKALLVVLILLFGCSTGNKITRRDLTGAQKLVGLEFSKTEQETMLGYLADNRAGYDSMRKLKLDYSLVPASYFDPRPDHFKLKVRQKDSDWKLPDQVILPSTDEDIAFLNVAELGALLKSGKLTSTRLTKIYLERLKKYDTLQAVVTITETLALQQAAAADAELAEGLYKGPLHGIPYGIKDLFAVPGYPTTWGAEPYEKQVINETATVVKKLEEAGAVLVAKLTSGALARGDVWFGGQTKNPWDLKQGASGSSAGSASATAAGLVAFSIGTETLGSILAPSARCGATGLRPTFGAVSREGAMSLSWSMDKAGPICRTAQDCAIVFEAIRGQGEKEMDRSVVNYSFAFHPPKDLKGYKIGYFKQLFERDTTRTRAANDAMLETMKSLGAELHEIRMPDSVHFNAFDIILRAEAGAFFDELVREHRDRLLSEQDESSRANSLRQSRFISAVEYLQAYRHRKLLIEKFNKILAPYDFVVGPENGRNLSLVTNLTGHPAMAIPSGFDKQGRPTSFALIGNLYDEGPMLEAAYLLQQATPHEEKHPDFFRK